MSYSQGFKVNVNKLNAEEGIYACLIIDHPFISEPVRLINDSKDLVISGDTYLAMPFQVKRQSDIQNELPKVQLSISNVGRSLVKWIDSSGGGRNASIKILLVRRSSSVIEEEIELGISSVSVTMEVVTFNLVIQNNLIKRGIRWLYDQNHSPGLF